MAGRLYNGIQEQMDYDNVATTVFSPLEYGCVGLTEEEAINRYTENKIEVSVPLDHVLMNKTTYTSSIG